MPTRPHAIFSTLQGAQNPDTKPTLQRAKNANAQPTPTRLTNIYQLFVGNLSKNPLLNRATQIERLIANNYVSYRNSQVCPDN
ncbi:hypothetical protein [Hydrotalea sp.]|uniref:hypothetical protein n=1 Tax=Hydrotalea sp. TaxID=2881279 RepID=UPI0026021716|nr:hypothetical protein [Hydrotalea sp.]